MENLVKLIRVWTINTDVSRVMVEQVGRQVKDQVYEQVYDRVWERVMNRVCDLVESHLGELDD